MRFEPLHPTWKEGKTTHFTENGFSPCYSCEGVCMGRESQIAWECKSVTRSKREAPLVPARNDEFPTTSSGPLLKVLLKIQQKFHFVLNNSMAMDKNPNRKLKKITTQLFIMKDQNILRIKKKKGTKISSVFFFLTKISLFSVKYHWHSLRWVNIIDTPWGFYRFHLQVWNLIFHPLSFGDAFQLYWIVSGPPRNTT